MKIIKQKTSFYKSLISLFLLITTILCSSCSNNEAEYVFSFEDKIITADVYDCYYSKNKENIVQTYKNYYNSYGESFKAYFGFMPDGTEKYWETTFWNEKQGNTDKTMKDFLEESTIRACKEYLVYEKIASDYKYDSLPEELVSQFEALKKESIQKYGSYEAWNIATIGQYGITADELMNLSYISSYGTVLPEFIFGEKGKNISDQEALDSLSNSIQFMYSVFYFQDEEIEENISLDISEGNQNNSSSETDEAQNFEADSQSNDESTTEKPPLTVEDYNKYYKELMHSYYDAVMKGEKTFEDVYKESDDYSYINKNAPNGFLLTKSDFKNYFSVDCELYKKGDIILKETEAGIFLIKFVDFSSDYISAKKEYLVDELFNDILESYFSKIKCNKNLLNSLNKNRE